MGGDPHHLALPAPVVVGARVAGPSHVKAGRGCEDAYAIAYCGPGRAAIAVADGLGSAANSGEGAALAVATAASCAGALLAHPAAASPASAARIMASAARRALEREAARRALPLRELACTFIAIAAIGGAVGVVHIGDGAVAADAGEGWAMLSGPCASEYANEVEPLTCVDWTSRLRTSVATGVRRLAAFTDGVQRAALRPGGEPSPRFLDPLFAFVTEAGRCVASAEIEALLGGPKLSEHSDDDKTLVLAILQR